MRMNQMASSSSAAMRWATPETEVWVLAPPSSSSETFSPVVASMTLGPVMNIWLF